MQAERRCQSSWLLFYLAVKGLHSSRYKILTWGQWNVTFWAGICFPIFHCICSTFLHCVSSNVSSNCLHKRMYNHTDCICLTFPRCALSNVLWEHLNIWMKIHIGCTCVTPYLGHSLPRYQQHRHSFQATQNLEGFYPLFLSEGWMSATWPHHVCLGTDYWALTGIDDDEKHKFSPKRKVKVYCSSLLSAVLQKKKRKWIIHHVPGI